ncbi:MAG TPA: hypothetical protein V6D05_16625 [Stenomitos sp.]
MRTKAIAATVLMTVALAGCGARVPGPDTGAASSTPKQTQGSSSSREEQPTQVNTDPQDVPTNIPQPIPNPEPPADPKALAVRAVANTVNSTALQVFNSNMPTRISIYADLTWSKVEGAAQYRVLRNDDGGDKYYLLYNVPATFRGYRDGAVMNLKVDTEYKYLVEALDSSGNVLAKGTDSTKALYPLPVPVPSAPDNNAENTPIAPTFEWNSGGGKPEGYYVEVFSGVYLTPMWRGYRSDPDFGTKITYGTQVEFQPGTSPAIWPPIVLSPAGNYTWTVTAIKTDTGNAATAKAWAKSNSMARRFYCGKKPVVGGN